MKAYQSIMIAKTGQVHHKWCYDIVLDEYFCMSQSLSFGGLMGRCNGCGSGIPRAEVEEVLNYSEPIPAVNSLLDLIHAARIEGHSKPPKTTRKGNR